jgi:hypothetical protein
MRIARPWFERSSFNLHKTKPFEQRADFNTRLRHMAAPARFPQTIS